jgi:hypothetical protein
MNQNDDLLRALAEILNAQKTKTGGKFPKPRVKVLPDDKGLRIRPYESNPELGFVQVQEVEIANSSLTWKRRRKRTALVKGNVDVLQDWLAEYKGTTLPGKIVIQEYLEEEIPDDLRREFFPREDAPNFDDIYESYVKRAGDDGVELMSDDQRIFRFQIYDEFDDMEDKFINPEEEELEHIEYLKENHQVFYNRKSNKFEIIRRLKFLEATPLCIQGIVFEDALEVKSHEIGTEIARNTPENLRLQLDYLDFFKEKDRDFDPSLIVNGLSGEKNSIVACTIPIDAKYNEDLYRSGFELRRVYFFGSGYSCKLSSLDLFSFQECGRLLITDLDKSKRQEAIQELIDGKHYKEELSRVVKLNDKNYQKEFSLIELEEDLKNLLGENHKKLEIRFIREEKKWFSVYVFGELSILESLIQCLEEEWGDFYGLDPNNFQVLFVEFFRAFKLGNSYLNNLLAEFDLLGVESINTWDEDTSGNAIHFHRYIDFFGDGVSLELNIKRKNLISEIYDL